MGLRDKLRAMTGAAPSASKPQGASRGGLVVRRTMWDVPELPFAPAAPRTLKRLGISFDWPGVERLLFLDTETTGLSGGAGTICFLVGLGFLEQGAFVTEQYLLGDYPDEPEMLARLAARLNDFDALVTFNGAQFDWPLIRSRATLMRLRLPEPPMIDLLPPARRLWKRRLGTVRLSVLEEKVLRQGRQNDLPGSEAPARFFSYLKCGDFALLEPVIEHNAQDIRSMLSLLNRLLGDYAAPEALHDPLDLFSLGRALERQGESTEAVRCYRLASLPRPVTSMAALRGKRAEGEALYAMGLLFRRLREYDRAAEAFEAAAERGGQGLKPMIELAKHAEHRLRDLEAAMGWTLAALALSTDANEQAALEHRRARIARKMKQIGGREA